MKYISPNELHSLIKFKIDSLKGRGKFRQEEILKRWSELFNSVDSSKLDLKYIPIVTLRASVSSGTYIRYLTDQIGIKSNLNAFATDIYRTSVENYKIEDAINFDD